MSTSDLPPHTELPGPSVTVDVPKLTSEDLPAPPDHRDRRNGMLAEGRDASSEATSERLEELLEAWMWLRFCQADEVELGLATSPEGDYMQVPIVDGEQLKPGKVDVQSMVRELIASEEYWTGPPIEMVVPFLTLQEMTRTAIWLSRHGEQEESDALDHVADTVAGHLASVLTQPGMAHRWMEVVLGEPPFYEGQGFTEEVGRLSRRGWLDKYVKILLTHEDHSVRKKAIRRMGPLIKSTSPGIRDEPGSQPSRPR